MDGDKITVSISALLDSSTESIPATLEARAMLSLAFTAFFQTDTFAALDEDSQRRVIKLFQDLNAVIGIMLMAKVKPAT